MGLRIKDIPVKERPRERLLESGVEVLSNIELLSIILKTGTKNESVLELSTKVLNRLKNMNEFTLVNKETFSDIKGIGNAKISEILASIELGKRIYINKNNNTSLKLSNSKEVYEGNKYLFFNKKQEYFYCLYLDNKKMLIERKLLFMGTLNKSIVHPREIFKEAYLLSASSIICMHNHPSGDITPSMDDLALTESLKEIGKLQAIPVVDHIIFGNDNYYSFYENGKL